jgi:hypothetical protein
VGSGWAGDAPADPGAPIAGVSAAEVEAFRAALAAVDGAGLGDRERVELVAELERAKGSLAAAQARVTHALRVSREEADARDVARSVGSEVALARRCPPSAGDRLVGMARALVTELPATLAALTAGVCSERHAQLVVQASAVLSAQDRAVLDARVGPLLGRLNPRQVEHAARRVAAELDAAAVVKRAHDAVRSRRVSVRPAPDGMAYLTVLGPMVEVVGAHAALHARAKAVAGGQCVDEPPDGRGVGAVAADTALALLSGRTDPGTVQPVEVHLVITDRALLGTGHPDRCVMEPARIPGHGPLPAPIARARLRGDDGTGPGPASGPTPPPATTTTAMTATVTTATASTLGSDLHERASVWLRRLYTSPDGRDLVAMDSHRRRFTGLPRRMLILRDDLCPTPWCGAPIVHADHIHPARDGGATSYTNGNGLCARCNHVKEAPGWTVTATDPLTHPPPSGPSRRQVVITTGTGVRHTATPPPLLGWGSDHDPDDAS